MANTIKSKFGSFLVSVVEKSVIGYFSNIRNNIVTFLETAPDNTAKLFFACSLCIFLSVLVSTGLIVLTVGVLFLILTVIDSSVNKLLVSGVYITVFGIIYFIGGIILIKGIGNLIHSQVSKATGKLVRKIEK